MEKKPSLPYGEVKKNDPEDTLDEGFTNHVEPQLARTSSLSDPVLIDIRDILQKHIQLDAENNARAEHNAKTKRDWMLAARVVNRFCFIFFTATLLAVTAIFFSIFHMNH